MRFRNVPPCKMGDRANMRIMSRFHDWSTNVEVVGVEMFKVGDTYNWDVRWTYDGKVYGWTWSDQCVVVKRAGET